MSAALDIHNLEINGAKEGTHGCYLDHRVYGEPGSYTSQRNSQGELKGRNKCTCNSNRLNVCLQIPIQR